MAQYSPNFEFQIFNTDTKERFDLDVEKITDYPLALTYSIKDVQDPSSSKGSYSKTFIIPATGHNNTTLKGLFSESLFDSHLYVEDSKLKERNTKAFHNRIHVKFMAKIISGLTLYLN